MSLISRGFLIDDRTTVPIRGKCDPYPLSTALHGRVLGRPKKSTTGARSSRGSSLNRQLHRLVAELAAEPAAAQANPRGHRHLG